MPNCGSKHSTLWAGSDPSPTSTAERAISLENAVATHNKRHLEPHSPAGHPPTKSSCHCLDNLDAEIWGVTRDKGKEADLKKDD